MAELQMRQIVVGQWVNTYRGGESFSIIGLSEDGKVYRYDMSRDGWVAWNMNEIPPKPSKPKEQK
jgi:hypothetical protein